MRALYWEQVEEMTQSLNPETNQIEHSAMSMRQLRSDHPLVTSAWVTGGMTAEKNSEMLICLHLISGDIKPKLHPDNKNVKRFNKVITAAQVESLDIPEAIEWINNLKSEE